MDLHLSGFLSSESIGTGYVFPLYFGTLAYSTCSTRKKTCMISSVCASRLCTLLFTNTQRWMFPKKLNCLQPAILILIWQLNSYRILRNKRAGVYVTTQKDTWASGLSNSGFGLKIGQLLRELWPFFWTKVILRALKLGGGAFISRVRLLRRILFGGVWICAQR